MFSIQSVKHATDYKCNATIIFTKKSSVLQNNVCPMS